MFDSPSKKTKYFICHMTLFLCIWIPVSMESIKFYFSCTSHQQAGDSAIAKKCYFASVHCCMTMPIKDSLIDRHSFQKDRWKKPAQKAHMVTGHNVRRNSGGAAMLDKLKSILFFFFFFNSYILEYLCLALLRFRKRL